MPTFLVLMCLLCCGYGMVLIFAKDTAWRIAAWSNDIRGVASERTDRWDDAATFRGVFIILFGFFFLWVRASTMPQPTVPDTQSGFSRMTTDGRPATPQAQQMFEQQINAHGSHGAPTSGGN